MDGAKRVIYKYMAHEVSLNTLILSGQYITATGSTIYVNGIPLSETSGTALVGLINGISGQLNVTGSNLQSSLKTLSGNLASTGSIIAGISGQFNISGSNLQNAINTLSGNLGSTGSYFLSHITTGISVTGGIAITGATNISGIGGMVIIQSGLNTILFSGGGVGGTTTNNFIFSGVSGINNLTGNVFITGTGNIVVSTSSTKIIISGSGLMLNPDFSKITTTDFILNTLNINNTQRPLYVSCCVYIIDTGSDASISLLIDNDANGIYETYISASGITAQFDVSCTFQLGGWIIPNGQYVFSGYNLISIYQTGRIITNSSQKVQF